MRKPPKALFVFLFCLLIGAGCILTVVEGIVNAPVLISAYFTKVEHPIRPHYEKYNAFLQEVVRRNRVDYVLAKRSPNLDKALQEFASESCEEFPGDAERLVYWINAYNLLVIKTVADHFPVKTI